MKKLQRNTRLLVIAAGILLISIILMTAIIPGILTDTKPEANPTGAAIGILLAIAIHLILFMGYIKIIKDTKRSKKKRRPEYLAIGILLIFFGVIYMDGALAFLNHENIFYVSILMFTSALCDFVAAILTVIVFFLKPNQFNLNTNIPWLS